MNINFSILPLKLLAIFFAITACNPRLHFTNTNPLAQPPPVQQEQNDDSPTENSKIIPTKAASVPTAGEPGPAVDPTPVASAPVLVASNDIDSFEQPEVLKGVEPTAADLGDDTVNIEKTIAALEKIPITVPKYKAQVITPTLTTELEKEIASMNEPPDPVETIDPNKFIATAAPEKPKEKSKPKEKPVAPEKIKALPEKKVVSEPQAANEGPGSNINTEFFQQAGGSKVDILFVVDNSPSMQTEQSRLGKRLQSFLNGIKDMDWQIAFTTSDVSKGKFGLKGSLLDLTDYPGQKILNKNHRDYESVFKNTVQRPEANRCIFGCPSSNEQPLKASILAMEKSRGENSDFFRLDASLAIVILSDEDEMSRGLPKATKPHEVVNAFHSIFGPSKKLSVYGIVIEPHDRDCYEAQKTEGFSNAAPGTHITQLAQLTNGITGSICDEDYAVSLEKIGEQTRLMSDIYKLKRIPIADSLTVELVPEQETTWKVEKDLLTFIPPPKEGTLVKVTYRYSL